MDKSHDELITLVKGHLQPSPIITTECFKFYTRKQHAGESVVQFSKELWNLAEICAFQNFLEEVIRDIFGIGLFDQMAQKKLLSEKDLKMKKAFDIALSHEMGAQRVKEMREKGPVAVNKGNSRYSGQECF